MNTTDKYWNHKLTPELCEAIRIAYQFKGGFDGNDGEMVIPCLGTVRIHIDFYLNNGTYISLGNSEFYMSSGRLAHIQTVGDMINLIKALTGLGNCFLSEKDVLNTWINAVSYTHLTLPTICSV